MTEQTNQSGYVSIPQTSTGKPDVPSMAPKDRKRRSPRSKVLPQPPTGVETPYANCREEWQGVDLGEQVLIISETKAWQEIMVPILVEVEADRPRKGPAPSYRTDELESAVLFQKLAGCSTYGKARTLLASDRHQQTRELLGFDRPRKRVGKGIRLIKSLDGVPSEFTIWNHLQRFGLERHLSAYRQLFERLLQEHLSDPQFREEARVLNLDGSVIRSHYSSFETKSRKTGEVRAPTLEEGGFMPRTEENHGKDGHGFNMISVTTSTGLPLAYRLSAIQENEGETALALFKEQWPRNVAPLLDPKLAVLSADSAFKARELRAGLHELGIVENCQAVSHAKRERSQKNAEAKDQTVWQVQGYPSWRANGHRELYCACGQGKVARRISRTNPFKKGSIPKAVVRVEGDCPACGSITITAGKWRKANHPRRFTRCLPGEEHQADWSFGNPFTFHDPFAKAFGRARFGHGEGFHGHLATRFGLLKDKSWHRSRKAAELDLLIVFTIMHSLAIEQRRRVGRGNGLVEEIGAGPEQSEPVAELAA